MQGPCRDRGGERAGWRPIRNRRLNIAPRRKSGPRRVFAAQRPAAGVGVGREDLEIGRGFSPRLSSSVRGRVVRHPLRRQGKRSALHGIVVEDHEDSVTTDQAGYILRRKDTLTSGQRHRPNVFCAGEGLRPTGTDANRPSAWPSHRTRPRTHQGSGKRGQRPRTTPPVRPSPAYGP